ncbi:MAG: thioester dehydrase [Gammaproteobacteria bacterium]|jgi:predicted hotdog family 3-hydroxylacyl-ACP dehydratase|nr:thioester dehydrase [Gammaproteobacteria bacterium]MDH3749058.1 thioester dehydrase [Gammaproteobacteria bacterium]
MTATISSEELKPLAGMSAAEFVLHREPMLFLDRLVDIGAEFATCEWRISDDFELVVPGLGVPAYAGVEYMAQCVAVHAGARARARGFVPPHGYLLGTRHYKCSVAYFEPGVTYQATCQELVRDSQGMGSFACRIELNGSTIAEANLAVLEMPQETKLNE